MLRAAIGAAGSPKGDACESVQVPLDGLWFARWLEGGSQVAFHAGASGRVVGESSNSILFSISTLGSRD